jgi:hypothetical protein
LPSAKQVEDFLFELAALRLLYEENGRFLALATSRRSSAPVERPAAAIAVEV